MNKSKKIEIRVTEEQKHIIVKRAFALGLSVSQYCLSRILDSPNDLRCCGNCKNQWKCGFDNGKALCSRWEQKELNDD